MHARTLLGAVIATLAGTACGYGLQQSVSDLTRREGVTTVYIEHVRNDTYRPGIENTVYNQALRAFGAGGHVRLVTRPQEADAILRGTVTTATYSPSAPTTTDKIFPSGKIAGIQGRSDVVVASEYVASLASQFELVKRGKVIWSSGFSRAKSFPATNQLGIYGNTAALINDSENDRALRELAQAMMADVHESMMSMF